MIDISSETTLVVPAAGLGTRMGNSDFPKSLVKFQGRALIDWATEAFVSKVNRMVIVIRSEHESFFREHYSNKPDLTVTYVIQDKARGTAFAVQSGLNSVMTNFALVVWGDHIGASFFPQSQIFIFDEQGNKDFILPLVHRELPYVYFSRKGPKSNLSFHETKKGSPKIGYGLSDCGVFLFKTKPILDFLKDNLFSSDGYMEEDLNFLSLFGSMQSLGLSIHEIVLSDIKLTYGVNSFQELDQLQRKMK